jgi:hypothetical protein
VRDVFGGWFHFHVKKDSTSGAKGNADYLLGGISSCLFLTGYPTHELQVIEEYAFF